MLETINNIFIESALDSAIVISVTIVSLFVLSTLLNKMIKKFIPNKYLILNKIKKYIINFIILFTILYQIKSMHSILTALLASGGIIAIVLGLACQEAASSTINGMMILFYKPFTIGDFIFISSHNVRGKVYDITLRHTVIETLEKTQVIIPNTIMNSTLIENISNVPNNKANHLFFDISYHSDYDRAVAIIKEHAIKHPKCIDQRTPEQIKSGIEQIDVYCMELKESSVLIRATIFTLDNMSGFELLSDLRIQIKNAFNENNILIPYPHIVIENKKVI